MFGHFYNEGMRKMTVAFGQVFNIGTGENYTVMDLVRIISGQEDFFINLPLGPFD